VLLRGGRRAAELEEGVGVVAPPVADGEGVDSITSSLDCILEMWRNLDRDR
jgi:hypothetical protein